MLTTFQNTPWLQLLPFQHIFFCIRFALLLAGLAYQTEVVLYLNLKYFLFSAFQQ